MSRWKLRTRLLLAYSGLLLLGFLLLSLLAGRQIGAAAGEDFARSLEAQGTLVARALADPLEHYLGGELARTELQTAVSEFAADLGMEVTLVDREGSAWLSSEDAPAPARSDDPEIRAALSGEVAQAARLGRDGGQMLYAAAPLLEDGFVLGAVRLAVPETAMQGAVARRWLTLGGVAMLLTGLALAAALALAASFARPLDQLEQAASDVARGDFAGRLPETRQDEFGAVARSFNHMSAQVEAMLAEQKAFAGNAAHELRAPLTSIRLRSEALRDGGLDEATAGQYIAEIDDEAARLGRLINDLLLLSRIDSGRMAGGESWIDPARLARQVCRDLDGEAAAQDMTIELIAPGTLPPIQAGQNHVQVLFTNILENALKYGRSGGHIIWSLDAVEGELQSVVQDDGQGLSADDLDHVFERFYRADKAHARETGGVGLGLPLAQAICQFYQGRVEISSPGPEQGTMVSVWWPLAQAREVSTRS